MLRARHQRRVRRLNRQLQQKTHRADQRLSVTRGPIRIPRPLRQRQRRRNPLRIRRRADPRRVLKRPRPERMRMIRSMLRLQRPVRHRKTVLRNLLAVFAALQLMPGIARLQHPCGERQIAFPLIRPALAVMLQRPPNRPPIPITPPRSVQTRQRQHDLPCVIRFRPFQLQPSRYNPNPPVLPLERQQRRRQTLNRLPRHACPAGRFEHRQ